MTLRRMVAHFRLKCALETVVLLFIFLAPTYSQGSESPSRPELVEIFDAVRILREPRIVDGIPDYSAAAVEKQKRSLVERRAHFDRLDPTTWSIRDQIDYLIVRSELDTLEYGFRVYRATSRNPNFYLSRRSSFGLSAGATLSRLYQLVRQPPPFDQTRIRQILDHMHNIPRILEQAKQNLTEPNHQMSGWALPNLVNARENSRNFAAGLTVHFPPTDVEELISAANKMGIAFEDYRLWIEERLPEMAGAKPIGREMYDWMLKRIWLLPYDADDILRFGEQEFGRYMSFTAFEEARNHDLPTSMRAKTTAEYAANTASDAERIRQFLIKKKVLTIPDYVGPYRRMLMPTYIQAFPDWAALSSYSTPGNGVMKYSVPEDHPFTDTYWEAIMRIDASTNIFHDGIPGHHYQGVVSARHPSPIRSQHRDRFKSEGWSTYWEETAIQLGFYDERPRSRELIYNFLRLRAIRVIVDVKMALGEMTVDEGTTALMSIPMDYRIAREEVDDFFAAPTGGIVYQIGKMQIERLLGERRGQLGEQFDLRKFHDELVAAAWVPLELTRWQMTGRGDNAQRMLEDRTPMPFDEPASPASNLR